MSYRSTAVRVLTVAFTAAIFGFARIAAAQVTELLPNLEAFPASDVQLVAGSAGLELRFSTTSWNRGVGPMELHGGELVGPDKQNVYQWVRRTDGTYSTYLVGTFEYHPEHNHFHFEDYALYELTPINAPGGSGSQGAKISFCLLDNVKVNAQLPNASKKAVYTTCNPDVQGISVGWGDRYGFALPGQSLPFGNNPSGDYLLRITIDPKGHLHESDPNNNVSCALVRIDVSSLSVEVIGNDCNSTSPVTISQIQPNQIRAGTSAPVVITGSGFQPGMSVTFENGSGKTPVASNVVVVDPGTISATVTVPNGGSTSDPVWDLRVGPATLPNALTVTR